MLIPVVILAVAVCHLGWFRLFIHVFDISPIFTLFEVSRFSIC
jgi:hypothetical protein